MSVRHSKWLPRGLEGRLALWVAVLMLLFGTLSLALSLRDEESLLRSVAIEDANRLTAIVAADAADPLLRLEAGELRRLIARVRTQPDIVEAYVFDEESRVITDGTYENPRRHHKLDAEVWGRLQSHEPNITLRHETAFEVLEPIEVGNQVVGGVGLVFSTSRLEQTLAAARWRNALLGFTFIVLSLLASRVLARRWMGPIQHLTNATERVAQGELDQAIEVRSNDELGLLAASFNTMTRRLRETTVSRDYMDRILDSMAECLLVVSPGGTVHNVNPAACALLRGRAEDLEGQPLLTLVEHPDLENDQSMGDILSGRRILRNAEADLVAWDGERIPAMVSITPLGQEEDQGVVCVASDLRELAGAQRSLQESEQRARQLIDGSPDAILILVGDKLVFTNPAGEDLLGATEEQIVGQALPRFLDPHKPSQAIDMLFEDNAPSFREQRWRRFDGSPVEVELAVSPLSWGETQALQLVLRDITERKRIERLKEEIMSVVSHELRTPLTALRGAVGILRHNHSGDAAQSQLLDMAYRNSERLTFLVNNILDLQRLEEGQLELAKERIDVAKLIWDSIEENRPLADQHDVDLVAREPSSAMVEADRERLLQVMAHLLSNAVKHSPNGGTVEVTTSLSSDMARIAVTNHGVTIPIELRNKIFEKFSLTDPSTTRQHNGTGLGLSLSKEIVELHGGRIDFESAPDSGTTFFVDLPVAGEVPS